MVGQTFVDKDKAYRAVNRYAIREGVHLKMKKSEHFRLKVCVKRWIKPRNDGKDTMFEAYV